MDDKININKISKDFDVSVIMFWRTLAGWLAGCAADWLFHYISMWFVWWLRIREQIRTRTQLQGIQIWKTLERIYHIVAHIETRTHTLRRRRWFCIFPYFIGDFFSVIFHSLTCSDCLHLFFHSPDHFVCIFHVAFFSSHYSLSSFDMPRKHRTISSFWWPMCHKHTHALKRALILKLKFTSSYLIFR